MRFDELTPEWAGAYGKRTPGAADAWPDELLEFIRHLLGAECLQLFECQLPQGALLGSRVATDTLALLAAHSARANAWPNADPFIAELLRAEDGELVRGEAGSRWTLGLRFHPQIDRAVLIVVCGPPAAGDLVDQAEAQLRELLPHLRRVARPRRAQPAGLGTAQQSVDILQQLPLGYVLTDQLGRCLDANDAFLKSATRFGMRVVMGRLRCAEPDQQAAWARALQEVHMTGTERPLVLRGGATAPVTLLLKPLRDRYGNAPERRAIVGVLLEAAGACSKDNGLQARSARLTRAELEVLASMLTGMPAKGIANQRGASINTVRTQITAVLEKMGFHSQRELIASFGASGYSGFQESGYEPPPFDDRKPRS